MNSNKLTENICALDITFHSEGSSLADPLPTESFGNSTSNNKLSADLWFPMCSKMCVAVQTVPPELLSESPDTFPSKFTIFYLFQHLSILHRHRFNSLFQPPLIGRGTCCSPAIWMLFFASKNLLQDHISILPLFS